MGEQNTGSVPVGGPPVTGPSPTGSRPGSAQKTQALVAGWSSSPCGSGAVKGGGDDTKQILALSSLDDHQESQSLLPRLVPMVGWLHILGTLKDLRSETNEAVPNHHGASAGWCDRLDCRIVSSASDTDIALEGARLNSHITCTISPEKHGLFFCDSSLKKKKNNTVVFKGSRAFWCRCVEFFLITHAETLLLSPAEKSPSWAYWSRLFHH